MTQNRQRNYSRQITFLVDDETSDAIDALAALLAERTGTAVSRSEAARTMLKYGKVPARRFAGANGAASVAA